MKVGIFLGDSNGGYPVPASRGGAVSTLVEHLVGENNSQQLFEMDVVSIYDSKAKEMSKRYSNINFIWIKPPKIIYLFDRVCFEFVRTFLKKKKAVSYKSLFSLAYCILASSKIIQKNNYDKIVLENNIPLAWCIKLSKYGGDYYYHFHNVPRVNAGCRKVFQNCTSILCVSQYVANQVASDKSPIGPIPIDKLKVLYNCVDTKQFVPLGNETEKKLLRNVYSLNEKDKIVCFVGRLSEEKGIDKVLEAVMALNSENIKVLIVGSYIHNIAVMDEYQKTLYMLAEKLGNNIVFTGYISQDEIQKIYQISDVAVLPSMWDEPAGLTMVEALACGTPVITTNAGGIPEYMKDNAITLERDAYIVQNISKSIIDLLSKEKVMFNCSDFDKSEYYFKFYQCIKS